MINNELYFHLQEVEKCYNCCKEWEESQKSKEKIKTQIENKTSDEEDLRFNKLLAKFHVLSHCVNNIETNHYEKIEDLHHQLEDLDNNLDTTDELHAELVDRVEKLDKDMNYLIEASKNGTRIIQTWKATKESYQVLEELIFKIEQDLSNNVGSIRAQYSVKVLQIEEKMRNLEEKYQTKLNFIENELFNLRRENHNLTETINHLRSHIVGYIAE